MRSGWPGGRSVLKYSASSLFTYVSTAPRYTTQRRGAAPNLFSTEETSEKKLLGDFCFLYLYLTLVALGLTALLVPRHHRYSRFPKKYSIEIPRHSLSDVNALLCLDIQLRKVVHRLLGEELGTLWCTDNPTQVE